MIPGAFEYHRPGDVAEVVKLLADLGEDAMLVAGGHSLIPMMKLRLAQPEHLIDLQGVASLRGIRVDGGRITIGAMTTQAELIASEALAAACPLLREAALQIADPQIRNLGTLGGNAANGDPGNDMPAVLQALDASYRLAGPEGEREVPARSFYEGSFFTARAEGEVLTAVSFDAPPAGHGAAYRKQKRKVGDYATAAAAVVLAFDGGRCSHAAIALTNVGDTPLYAEEAGKALVGTGVGSAEVDAAVAAAEAVTQPASDGRGPAEYRTRVAGVMVRRAITDALSRAKR